MRKWGIRKKLFVLIFIILIPLVVLEVARIKRDYDNRVNEELDASEELAEAISKSFINYIEELWVQEAIMGSYISQNPHLSSEEIQEYLVEVQKYQKTIRRFTWVNPKGIAISSTNNKVIGKNLEHREYLHKILNGKDKVISNLVRSVVDGEPIVIVVRAVRKDGNLLGMIAGVVNVVELSEKLPHSSISDGSRFGLIDQKGMMVYKSDKNNISYQKRKIPDNSPAWKALKGEIVRTIKRSSGSDQSIRMGIDYPIKEIGWDCFITSSYDNIMAVHKKNAIIDLITLGIITLISIIGVFIIYKSIINPINSLKNTATKVASGDLSVRTNIVGSDEIAVTAQAFDEMVISFEEYDRLKTQFFSTVSHELKTPLNVILGTIQLLQTLEGDGISTNISIGNRYLKIMKQNCYRLLRLINNLIDITRLDAGFLKMDFKNYNIVSIIEDITLSVAEYVKSKDIDLLFDTEIEEKIIACDADRVERVMLNLLSNAIKFTKSKGSIVVNIYNGNGSIVISVKDSGIGIPKDMIDKIFDRFEQVDSTLRRKVEGSGIGLSLVKSIIEEHGGTISVVSEWGKGSEFIIKLPDRRLDDEVTMNEKFGEISHTKVERIQIEFSDIYS